MTTKKNGKNGNGATATVSPAAAASAANAAGGRSQERIELPKLRIERAVITLIGDSPLISHRWSEKARKQMLQKQMKEATQGKAAKDPWEDFCDSLYWLAGRPNEGLPTPSQVAAARFGFPTVGFKAAAVDACSHIDGVTKVEARGAFHISGDLLEVHGPPPVMREDMVRVGMGTADIRYRGQFDEWMCEFEVRFNSGVLSLEQLLNLLNTAGFAIGVGEWRPQRDGSMGMFHVATPNEKETVERLRRRERAA